MRILPCEDTGRMQVKAGAEIGGDVLTRQGVPRITGHHKDRRERHGTGSQGAHLAHTLILDILPPEL